MVQNNKVLTVSYGTFSCTLEGFDDSFETMKAIAEYFRDLAAEDRYFGSEPPQPDAEMLTRIAQRDGAHRVEASQNDTGLLLRATEDSAAAAPTPAAIAPTPAHEPVQTTSGVVPPAATTPGADPAPEPVSIAAKLQRIRAVVSHSDEASSDYSEEEDAGYLEPAKPQFDAISAAFDAGALNPADLEEPAEDITPSPEPEPQQVSEPKQMEDTAELPAHEDEALAQEDQPSVEEDDVQAQEDEPVAQENELATTEVTEVDVPDLVAEEDQTDTTDEPELEDQTASAEVTDNDVLFADLDDTSEADEEAPANILNDDDGDDTSEEMADFAQGVISAEDEALLLDEIALVESELAANTSAELPDMTGLNEDVSRLMDKADARLDDPTSSDQRETYSHLRTAVAATEAEREKNGDNAQTPEDDYRGDLASVVNPRRPEVQVTSERPSANTSAPLKLVAAQRIDTEDADTGPVTPRRVTSAEDSSADEEGGFANFAQEQGAQSLPDLLEAAAAYLSFIEGQEQFSRPQLMNKVRSLKQEAFNREESLRSFGQLLRDGKIEKAGGGRFAASTQIGFRPNGDERAAG